ncbi:non-ribosomal peptide synthetase [Nocardia sp. CNY236]|uniref:non-ribosomal peptide synthetase n=1 Tax=Nocardia sp. CNY236 TaxID=1169152 RepID=UPI0004021437|nr:non-ribosomal peptide synthetase [Nocardia sp. CNY236]
MTLTLLNRIDGHLRTRGQEPAIEALDPDDTAIVVTYDDLARSTEHADRALAEAGVKSGDPVKVAMRRTPELVATLLAIWRAGAYYVPIPGDNSARAHQIAQMYPGAVTVTDASSEATLRVVAPPTHVAEAALDRQAEADPSLAYVMFTSGSTGTPKGVAIPRDAVERLVLDPTWDDGLHHRVGMVAPHAFQLSTYEMWVPLARGGTIVMAPHGPLDYGVIAALARRLQGHSLHLTAGLFRAVAVDRPSLLAGISEVATGGDVVSPAAIRAVLEHCPGTTVRPIYGCTEGVLFSTTQSYSNITDIDRLALGGHAFAGATITVVDADLHELPAGEVGEICIGGERLAARYLDQPELTSKQFVRRPEKPFDRIYRTGDIGRTDGRGELVLLGRADRQVKIRGFRVELAEVEYALSNLTGVRDVAVKALDPATDRTRLIAAVTGTVESPSALRRMAQAAVPDYMIPEEVKVMPSLPLTPNGKVDWSAIIESIVPRLVDESAVCRLFGKFLHTETVAPHDNFFDLGGQSITAMRLAAALSEHTGVELSARQIFDAPSPRQLCAVIDFRRP